MKNVFNNIFFIIAIASFVLSCSDILKERDSTEQYVRTVIEVQAPSRLDSLSKTGISAPDGGKRHTFWCEGDRLALNGIASEPLEAKYAGTSFASFTWVSASSGGNLLYPASFWKDDFTITLPYGQDKMPGEDNIATDCCPMCGIAESGYASLKHLCAILKIQWVQKSTTQQAPDICYLEFRGRSDEQVSGDFSIDYSAATLTGISSAPESRYVRAYSMKKVGADTSVCNIVVPAGTYAKGFFVRIVDKAGYYMEVYTSKSKTLAEGTVVAMPCFKYNPSTKLSALTPASAGELIAIAQEWNAGRYEGGIANICLASDIEFDQSQSREWVSIGGLGCEKAPYKGTFDGKGYSIKGLESTIPIFGAVAAEGSVVNVVVDSTCNFKGSRAALVGVLAGKVSSCTNDAVVSFCPALKTISHIGGLVSEAVSGAVIENCTNNALIHLDAFNMSGCVSGSTDNPKVSMGGILGYATGAITVKGCSNAGKLFCDYNTSVKINQRPSWIGGIIGRVDGGGSTISDCNNTAGIFNSNWNNSNDLSGPVSGCIVGVVDGVSGSSVKVNCCKVLGPELMQTLRGIQGGIIGYASCANISNCYFSKNHVATWGNIPSNSGGICGKALSCTVSSCTVEDATMYCKTTMACNIGGICGWMDASSKALNNSALRTKIVRNGSDDFYFGGVVGAVEDKNSEISGNSFGGKYSTDGGKNYSSFSASNVCSSTSFTVNSPNTLVESAFDLSGVVMCDSAPMEGVVVTDGYQSVKTDANGRFHLTSLPSKVRYVSVCLPEGYGAPRSNGLPKFFVKTGGEPKDDISFTLRKIDNPDRYSVFVTADPQQRGRYARYDYFAYHSGTVASNLYESIGNRASTISGREVYGIVLGDVVHEAMDLYSNHTTDLKNYCSTMSTYHVIGNHDHNPSASTAIEAMADFENNFGPVNYSMNIGKFHYVMLDDIQIKKDTDGTMTAYDQGLSDDQITWLKSDLQYVPTSTPLIVCAHAPLFAKHYSANKYISYSENSFLNASAYKEIFSKYSRVYVFGGHIHHNFTFIYAKEKPSETALKGVQCIQLGRSCGELWINDYITTDGTPRGYMVMDIDGTAITWKYVSDVLQKAVFLGSYGSSFSYPAPSYNDRDWNYTSGVPKLKSDGSTVDENYQMKLYADKSGCLWANIFMWDALWGTPVMEYTNSSGASVSVNMTKVALSDGPSDFAYAYLNQYYADNNSYWKSSASANPLYSSHMFKCTMPSDCPSRSARVSVKDRFGTIWTSEVNW